MRNTSAALADFIPDITIRTRAEVEAEEAAAEAEEDAHSDDEKPIKSSRKAGGFSQKGVSQKGGPSMMRGPLHEDILENKLLNGVREGSTAASQDGRSSSQVNGLYATPPPGGTPIGDLETLDPAQVAQQAHEEGEDDSDEGDALSREWSQKTQQARAKYALRRHKLLRKPLGEEEQALTRAKKGMQKFKEWEERVNDVVRFQEPEPDPEADDVLVHEEEDTEEDQFLAEYEVASGTLNGLLNPRDTESIRNLYAWKTKPPEYLFYITCLNVRLLTSDDRVRPPSGGLLEIMRENVRKLMDIRKTCNKIAAIRNMGQQPPGVSHYQIYLMQVYQPPAPPSKQPDLEEYIWSGQAPEHGHHGLQTSPVMNAESARYVMEQTIAKLLFHSGFEGCVVPI